MNTVSRLKFCNRTLGFVLILMLASSIQLEVTSGIYSWSMWGHIVFGILLTILSCYHIYLHYRRSNWYTRFAKDRNKITRLLWWVFLLTVVTGIVSTIIWLDGNQHSHLGAVHGKIGFLMVVVTVIHAIRNMRKNWSSQIYTNLIHPTGISL